MTTPDKQLWQGLAAEARTALVMRDYGSQTFSQQLAGAGVEAGKLASADRTNVEIREAWIPGVEIFPRTIYPQRHRGSFGEFVRRDEGVLGANRLLASAMGQRAHVCADCERLSRSSPEHP